MVLDNGALHTAGMLPPLGHSHCADGEPNPSGITNMKTPHPPAYIGGQQATSNDISLQNRKLVELEAKAAAAEKAVRVSNDAQKRMADSLDNERRNRKKAQEGVGIHLGVIHELQEKIQEERKNTERTQKKVDKLEIELMDMAAKFENGDSALKERIDELEKYLFTTQDELGTTTQELMEERNRRLAAEKELKDVKVAWEEDKKKHGLDVATLTLNFDHERDELNEWRGIIEEKKRTAEATSAHAAVEKRSLMETQSNVMQQVEALTKLKEETDRAQEQLRRERKEEVDLREAQTRWDAERSRLEQQKLELKLQVEKLSRDMERQQVQDTMTENKKLEDALEKVVAGVWEKENSTNDEAKTKYLETVVAKALQNEEERKAKAAAANADAAPALTPAPPPKKGGKGGRGKKGGKKK